MTPAGASTSRRFRHSRTAPGWTTRCGTAGVKTTSYSSGYFSGTTPIANCASSTRTASRSTRDTPRAFGSRHGGQRPLRRRQLRRLHRRWHRRRSISIDRPTASRRSRPRRPARRWRPWAHRVRRWPAPPRPDRVGREDGVAVAHDDSSGPHATPAPLRLTIAELNANPEFTRGRLVSVTAYRSSAARNPSSPAPFDAFVVVGDGAGGFVMKIDHDTDVEGFTPASVFTLTGIVQQDDFLRPFDSNYNVAPRSRVDLGAAAPAPPPLLTIGEARADLVNNADLNPTPDFIPDLMGKVVKVRGTVTSINFRPAGPSTTSRTRPAASTSSPARRISGRSGSARPWRRSGRSRSSTASPNCS